MSFCNMWVLFVFLLFVLQFGNALPEIGHFNLLDNIMSTNIISFAFPKSAYRETSVIAQLSCTSKIEGQYSAKLISSPCADIFADVNSTNSNIILNLSNGDKYNKVANMDEEFTCSDKPKTVQLLTKEDGMHLFTLKVSCANIAGCPIATQVNVVVDIKGDYGYLSAIEYPLRTFYGLLCLAYLLLGFLWLTFTFCHWKDLLRIQYYITLVISIGIIEQITFYALYETLNKTGEALKSALVFAAFISCAKRTIARYLVMIACVGYGITKSRLGTAYRRMIIICVAYFIFSLIDIGFRVFRPRFKPSLYSLIASLPLVLIDLAILWWSFSYLLTTLRETRMRRNRVKHRLYRIFSTLLIMVSCVSIVCMCASVFVLHWKPCTRAWRYIWFDETFWQLLFFVVLFAIVVLWRPSSTNKLYARSAFLDPDVEPPAEDMEELLIEAIVSGMNDESESKKNQSKKDTTDSEDDALRWAEDNIPSAGREPETGDKRTPFRPPMKTE